MAPYVVGLDIGYSNLKMIAGSDIRVINESSSHLIWPSGAAPLSDIGGWSGDKMAGVDLDGERWVTGIDHTFASGVRPLHDEFPSTKNYMALYRGALSQLGASTVDCLVTGLPVAHYNNVERRRALKKKLVGKFDVANKTVHVLDVQILQKPLGGYADHLYGEVDRESAYRRRVLILDAGFFSVDWAVVEESRAISGAWGTSTQACSYVLEEAVTLLQESHHALGCDVERLEDLLRREVPAIYPRIDADSVDLAPVVVKAARPVSERAMTAVANSLRGLDRTPDEIILVGGGAPYYVTAARNVLKRRRIRVLPSPALAAARGYWLAGQARAENAD